MNYFEHHIGDYDKNTSHLTACEDGIYSRMIRRYMDKEKPLDSDVNEIKRLVRARTSEEKKAVATILKEFFSLDADGWHHKTCDETIAAYQSGEPEREVKKANEENRLKRHREERARLFKVVTDAGQHAPWNIGMNELRDIVSKLSPSTPETVLPPLPATAPATPATATQTPIPNTHTPYTNTHTPKNQEQPQQQPLSDDLPVAAPKPKKSKAAKPAEPGTGKAWAAYANAYWQRYGVAPVRNAMVNGQLSALVKRIGVDDAEQVAAFYVGHKHRFYVEKMHPVGLLLADCEKLRTEWATSTQMTATRAQQQDRTQTNLDAFAPLIAAAREREQAEKESANASQ